MQPTYVKRKSVGAIEPSETERLVLVSPNQHATVTRSGSSKQTVSNSKTSSLQEKNMKSTDIVEGPSSLVLHKIKSTAIQRPLTKKREAIEPAADTLHQDEIKYFEATIRKAVDSEPSERPPDYASERDTMIQTISSFRGRANKRFCQQRNCLLKESVLPAPTDDGDREQLDFKLDFQEYDVVFQTSTKGPQPPLKVPLHFLLKQREYTGRRFNCSHFSQRYKLSVPFSRLETPLSEAVLGLDCDGQYSVALAGTDSGLALKFYGVPCRDQIERRRTKRLPCMAPLLQTVRLNMPRQDGFHDASPVANFAVQIVISSDWKIGAAIIQHSKSSFGARDDANLGSLVLFELPSTDTPDTNIPMLPCLTCANVRIGGEDDFTLRNRLWKTSCVPVAAGTGSRITHISVQPGYLFLHDEDDGFRLSWVVDKRISFGELTPVSDSTLPNTPTREDIVTLVDGSSWERTSQEKSLNVEIAMESYLHFDALLDEIRSKRPDVFHYDDLKCPDFYYRLISMSSCGRLAQIVMVFSNQVQRLQTVKKVRRLPNSIGVFLQIDLFTQNYREVEWGQYNYALEPKLLRKWASLLALNRRMKERRAGPFCLHNPPKWVECNDWSAFLVEENTIGKPTSTEEWSRYLKDMKSTKIKVHVPEKIPYTMLYPDADIMSNEAVRWGIPVPSLKCRSGATEFVYG